MLRRGKVFFIAKLNQRQNLARMDEWYESQYGIHPPAQQAASSNSTLHPTPASPGRLIIRPANLTPSKSLFGKVKQRLEQLQNDTYTQTAALKQQIKAEKRALLSSLGILGGIYLASVSHVLVNSTNPIQQLINNTVYTSSGALVTGYFSRRTRQNLQKQRLNLHRRFEQQEQLFSELKYSITLAPPVKLPANSLSQLIAASKTPQTPDAHN